MAGQSNVEKIDVFLLPVVLQCVDQSAGAAAVVCSEYVSTVGPLPSPPPHHITHLLATIDPHTSQHTTVPQLHAVKLFIKLQTLNRC